MHEGMHRLFLAKCERKMKTVSAAECERCEHGMVVENKAMVICGGMTKFFVTPCLVDMKAAATVNDCDNCQWGELGEDRLRVYCCKL